MDKEKLIAEIKDLDCSEWDGAATYGFDECRDKVIELITRSAPQWISVKDRLPEDSYFVDVFLRSTENPTFGQRGTSVLFASSQFKINQNWNCVYVSHWMPLPKEPEQ